jgi:hypothetical protein
VMSYGGAAAAPASEKGKGAARAAPPIGGHIAGAFLQHDPEPVWVGVGVVARHQEVLGTLPARA